VAILDGLGRCSRPNRGFLIMRIVRVLAGIGRSDTGLARGAWSSGAKSVVPFGMESGHGARRMTKLLVLWLPAGNLAGRSCDHEKTVAQANEAGSIKGGSRVQRGDGR